MADDADAVYPQQRCSSILRIVHPAAKLFKRGFKKEIAQLAKRGGSDVSLQKLADRFGQALAYLQGHIPDEAVTDYTTRRSAVNITSLDVADEVQGTGL